MFFPVVSIVEDLVNSGLERAKSLGLPKLSLDGRKVTYGATALIAVVAIVAIARRVLGASDSSCEGPDEGREPVAALDAQAVWLKMLKTLKSDEALREITRPVRRVAEGRFVFVSQKEDAHVEIRIERREKMFPGSLHHTVDSQDGQLAKKELCAAGKELELRKKKRSSGKLGLS